MDKLKYILEWSSKHKIFINQEFAIKFWLLFKFIKDIIKENFFFLGVSLWIFHLYKNSWHQAFNDIKKAVLLLTILLSVYSFVEIFYLKGNVLAKDILITINPFFYDVQSSHGWWPPLLWNGQLRSLFPEPSFFGIVAAMILPFLFSDLLSVTSFDNIFIFYFYCFMLFLTRARTATLLYLGEMVLLICITWHCLREYWRKILCILICGGLAFCCTIL
jgi:hypothetical protein